MRASCRKAGGFPAMTVLNVESLPTPGARAESSAGAVAIKLTEFDQRRYLRRINARGEAIRRVVAELKRALGGATAPDAGVGGGFFGTVLPGGRVSVRGVDGRK